MIIKIFKYWKYCGELPNSFVIWMWFTWLRNGIDWNICKENALTPRLACHVDISKYIGLTHGSYLAWRGWVYKKKDGSNFIFLSVLLSIVKGAPGDLVAPTTATPCSLHQFGETSKYPEMPQNILKHPTKHPQTQLNSLKTPQSSPVPKHPKTTPDNLKTHTKTP